MKIVLFYLLLAYPLFTYSQNDSDLEEELIEEIMGRYMSIDAGLDVIYDNSPIGHIPFNRNSIPNLKEMNLVDTILALNTEFLDSSFYKIGPVLKHFQAKEKEIKSYLKQLGCFCLVLLIDIV